MHAKPASWLVIIEALAIEHCTAKDNNNYNNNNTRQQGNKRAMQGKTRQDAALTLAAGREAKDHKATPSGQQKKRKKNKSCALIWHRAVSKG